MGIKEYVALSKEIKERSEKREEKQLKGRWERMIKKETK